MKLVDKCIELGKKKCHQKDKDDFTYMWISGIEKGTRGNRYILLRNTNGIDRYECEGGQKGRSKQGGEGEK